MDKDLLKKYLNWFTALVALPLLLLAAEGQLPTWTVWVAFTVMVVLAAVAAVASLVLLCRPIQHRRTLAKLSEAIDVDSRVILSSLEKAGDSAYTLLVGNILQTWVDEGMGSPHTAAALRSHLRTIGSCARTTRLQREARQIDALQVHQINEQLVDSYIQVCKLVADAFVQARAQVSWTSKSRFENDWPKVVKQLRTLSTDTERLSKRINMHLKGYGAREYFEDVPT